MAERYQGWHRRPDRVSPARTTPQSYTHLPNGQPVDLQPDIDAQHQYWCDLYGADPYGFVCDMFDWGKPYTFLAKRQGPYTWQAEILEDCTKHLAEDPSIYRLGIAAGKGIGKTALLSQLYLWHIMTHRYSQSNLLGVTGDAIDQRVWAEIARWFYACKARQYFRRYKGGKIQHVYHAEWEGAYQLWSAGRLEALHGSHAPYLGYFIDEGCGLPNEVLETIESGLMDEHVFMAVITNPTRLRSRVRQYFPEGTLAHLWRTWQIDVRTTERYNPARVQEILDEAGGDEDDARVRVNVCGLFPLVDAEQFITDAMVEAARERYTSNPSRLPEGEPEGDFNHHEPIIIGVDVAAMGANRTVFLVRQGARILTIRSYAKKEPNESADLLMDLMTEYRHWHPEAYIDVIGYGRAVYADCKKYGFTVHEVNSGLPAIGPHADRFLNRRMELWDFTKEWLRHEAMLNPKYTTLAKQLTGPSAFVSESDRYRRLQLESKEDMQSRGVVSPDEADALVYSFGGLTALPRQSAILKLRY